MVNDKHNWKEYIKDTKSVIAYNDTIDNIVNVLEDSIEDVKRLKKEGNTHSVILFSKSGTMCMVTNNKELSDMFKEIKEDMKK